VSLRGLTAARWDELFVQQRRSVGVEVADRHTLVRIILCDDFPLLCDSEATVYSTRWLCADGTEGAWIATTRNRATFAVKQGELYPVLL
jgi:hypothetical protein